jgi:hypothetical protein
MVAVGSLIGYGAGSVDMVKVFGTALGDTQFKQMTAIAAAALLMAVGITSYAVKERILISPRYANPSKDLVCSELTSSAGTRMANPASSK